MADAQGELSSFVDVRHFQFCAKKNRYHARIVQSFTCFTRALHAADHLWRFVDLEDTPLCLLFGTCECQTVLN